MYQLDPARYYQATATTPAHRRVATTLFLALGFHYAGGPRGEMDFATLYSDTARTLFGARWARCVAGASIDVRARITWAWLASIRAGEVDVVAGLQLFSRLHNARLDVERAASVAK